MNDLNHLFDLTGKTAIVTGASYGLGVTFAKNLAKAGAKLVLAARSMDKLQQVAKDILNEGGSVHTQQVTDIEELIVIREQTVSKERTVIKEHIVISGY